VGDRGTYCHYETGTYVCEASHTTCTRLYSTGGPGRRGLIDTHITETVLSVIFLTLCVGKLTLESPSVIAREVIYLSAYHEALRLAS